MGKPIKGRGIASKASIIQTKNAKSLKIKISYRVLLKKFFQDILDAQR